MVAMGKEIERKFLIEEDGEDFSTEAMNKLYNKIQKEDWIETRQGYLSEELGKTLAEELDLEYSFEPAEYRLRDRDGELSFTIKGKGGLDRSEKEKRIGRELFQNYWPNTEGSRIHKTTVYIPYQGFEAEIDFYTDRDLIVAEVETPTEEEAEAIEPLGKDITQEKSYKNRNMAS